MKAFQKYLALLFFSGFLVFSVLHLQEADFSLRSVRQEKIIESRRVYWSEAVLSQFPDEWADKAKSQKQQDRFMFEHAFAKKTGPGVFVEFGGLDGLDCSNTFFYEYALGWKGILIEADKKFFDKLQVNRPNAKTIHGAVCPEKGELEFLVSEYSGWSGPSDTYTKERLSAIKEKIKVKCYTLNDVLEENGLYHVDYMTVDTEGSEYEALKNVDFSKFKIDFLQVEALSYDTAKKDKIKNLLISRGYRLIIDYFVSGDTVDMMFERVDA